MSIKDLNITKLYYDPEQTRVDLIDSNHTFGMHFINAALTLVVDYEVILDPPILEDAGAFAFSFKNLTFEGFFQTMLENEGTPEQQF